MYKKRDNALGQAEYEIQNKNKYKYKRQKIKNTPSDMFLLVVVCGKRQEAGQRPGSSSVQCLLDASFGHDHNGYIYNTNMDHRHHWMMTIIPDDKRNVARTICWHKFGFFSSKLHCLG